MSEKIDEVAKAVYAVIPNGGEVHRLTTATSQSGRAIYEKVFVADTWDEAPDRHDKCREIARAAIAAMRKPTPEMINSAECEWPAYLRVVPSGALVSVWQAMVDEALK